MSAEPEVGAPRIEWAGYLADLGRTTGAFKVFPCRPDDGRRDEQGNLMCKRPRFKGWQEAASWDRKTAATPWVDDPRLNIGLAVQRGFVVLDADIYKSGNEALLAEFEATYGALPDTMEFASASGGRHLIYSTQRLLGNSIGALPKFGDVRGFGGYIVGPGSTAEGRPYTVIDGGAPVALPKHVDDRLVERRERTASDRQLPSGVTLDDPTNVARYTIWLREKALTGDEDDRQNDKLAAAGAMGSSYGLSEDETVRLMGEHFNPRLADPWDTDKLEYHGGSGYRSANSKFGNMCEPKLFTAVTAKNNGQVWFDMSDIMDTAPAREWALGDDTNGWVPLGGVTLLYGAGGTGKTALVGQWALAQARGEPLLGLATLQMPVVLVAAEDSKEELHRRFEAQGRRADDQVSFAAVRGEDTAFHPSFRKEGGEDTWLFSLVDHKLASMPAGPKMLILDNLGQLYQGSYIEQSEILRFVNMYLGRLARKHEATIVVLAHPSESQRASGDGGMGGVGWSAGVRARLYFEHHVVKTKVSGATTAVRLGRERVLSRKKGNYADDAGDQGIVVDWDNWKFVTVEKKRAPAVAPFKSVEPRGESVNDQAKHKIAQDAIEHILSTNPMRQFSGRQLSADTAHYLATKRHEGYTAEAIRTTHLRKMLDTGHRAYCRVEGKGHWRHASLN